MADWRESEWSHFRTRARQLRTGEGGGGGMSAWRDLLNALRGQARATESRSPGRPTSLFEAGSVGSGERRAPARDHRDEAPTPRFRPGNRYPETLVEAEAQRRGPVQADAPRRRTDSRAALRTALRSPASLRTAMLLREILDPPVALREDRR